MTHTPPHPYWCDYCGEKSSFVMPGCEIPHTEECERYGEDAMQVYQNAVNFCKETGLKIK